MSGRKEIKKGMYTEDLSEEERREQYELSDEDIAEIAAEVTDDSDEE